MGKTVATPVAFQTVLFLQYKCLEAELETMHRVLAGPAVRFRRSHYSGWLKELEQDGG